MKSRMMISLAVPLVRCTKIPLIDASNRHRRWLKSDGRETTTRIPMVLDFQWHGGML